MHQTADGKVRHQQPEKFLADQLGSFAPQHDLRAAQVSFEFVKCCFYLPALMVQSGQFPGRRLFGSTIVVMSL
jgi:hypothetical protein